MLPAQDLGIQTVNYSHLRSENDDDVVDNSYHRNLIIPAQLIAIKTQGKICIL